MSSKRWKSSAMTMGGTDMDNLQSFRDKFVPNRDLIAWGKIGNRLSPTVTPIMGKLDVTFTNGKINTNNFKATLHAGADGCPAAATGSSHPFPIPVYVDQFNVINGLTSSNDVAPNNPNAK